MQLLWTAFIMGLAGSMHCLLMCGPLAMSAQSASYGGIPVVYSRLLYQAGRLTSYLVIGLLFGAVGKMIALIFYQQVLSVVSGSLLLLWVLFSVLPRFSGAGSLVMRLWSGLTSGLWGRIRKSRSGLAVAGLGMLNGFLPCGLVYLAATASIHQGSLKYSLAYMLLFGLGTLPAMIGVVFSKKLVPGKWRFSLRRLSPVFLTLLGLLFVVRGLNLGIPYLSPHMARQAPDAIPVCCGKPLAGNK